MIGPPLLQSTANSVRFVPVTSRGREQKPNAGAVSLAPVERDGRRKGRRAAMLRALLVGVRQLDQQRLAPGAAEERQADRQAERVASWHRDRRIPGHPRLARSASATVSPLTRIGQPRRPHCRRDQRVRCSRSITASMPSFLDSRVFFASASRYGLSVSGPSSARGAGALVENCSSLDRFASLNAIRPRASEPSPTDRDRQGSC